MKLQTATIWAFPTLICTILFAILFLIICQRPFTGSLVGFLVGQLLSLATFAIEDCCSKIPSDVKNENTWNNATVLFFSLWGTFFRAVFKLSVIGVSVLLGGIFLVILILIIIYGGL